MPHEFLQMMATPFDQLPVEHTARVYGVRYAVLHDSQGGEMYVTQHGWRLLQYLAPTQWYSRQQYLQQGRRLSEGTGHVYRVTASGLSHGRIDLVVKVSRFAQDVPLHIQSTFPEDIRPTEVDHATFLSPFEEFGLLTDLRNGHFGPADLRIRTKRPLAIYRSPPSVDRWRLGRVQWRFQRDAARLKSAIDRDGYRVELAADHEYLVLFHWIEGRHARAMAEAGLLTGEQVTDLTRHTALQLHAKGFRVLDHKPQHIILRRRRRDGRLVRRHGKIVYALVDFELLERTEAYQQWLAERNQPSNLA